MCCAVEGRCCIWGGGVLLSVQNWVEEITRETQLSSQSRRFWLQKWTDDNFLLRALIPPRVNKNVCGVFKKKTLRREKSCDDNMRAWSSLGVVPLLCCVDALRDSPIGVMRGEKSLCCGSSSFRCGC